MRHKQKSRGKAARGGLSHFTMRRFNAVPVSDGMCQLSVKCLVSLVALLQVLMPIPLHSLAIACLVVVGYGVAVFYVKAVWQWRTDLQSSMM